MHTLLTFNNTTHTIHHPRGRYKRTIHTPADDTSGRYIHSSGRYRRTIHTLQRTIHANSLIRYRYTREILGRQFSCAGGPYGGNVGFLHQVGPRRKRFFKSSEASPKNTPGKARRKRTFRRLERIEGRYPLGPPFPRCSKPPGNCKEAGKTRTVRAGRFCRASSYRGSSFLVAASYAAG